MNWEQSTNDNSINLLRNAYSRKIYDFLFYYLIMHTSGVHIIIIIIIIIIVI